GRWTSLYDARGLVSAQMDPLGVLTTNLYDANGNLAQKIDPRALRTTYLYEFRDLPSATLFTGGARWTFGWDAVPHQIELWDETGRRQFTYDRADQNTLINNLTLGWRMTYGYD